MYSSNAVQHGFLHYELIGCIMVYWKNATKPMFTFPFIMLIVDASTGKFQPLEVPYVTLNL